MTYSREWLIYKIIVLYCFLASARASLTLGENQYLDLLLGIVGLLIIPKNFIKIRPTKKSAAFILSISAMYTVLGGSIVGYFAQLSMIFIPLQLIFLKRNYQKDLFNWLTKVYAALLLASLTWWILWQIGVPLPHSTQTLEWQYDDDGFILENYYLFRHTIAMNPLRAVESLFRFNGFFLEPGHVGSVTSIFLFINKYNTKEWYNKVFFIVIILSFSAAAFAISIIGYFIYRFSTNKRKLILPTICIVGIVICVLSINNGDNPINDIIIGKFTRENGAIEGRFSTETQKLWKDIISDGRIIFGVGAGAEVPQSAGYKVFLIMNGIVGAGLTLISYWLILKANYSRFGRYLFILMIITFVQRAYCFWDAFLDPYILGLASFKSVKS